MGCQTAPPTTPVMGAIDGGGVDEGVGETLGAGDEGRRSVHDAPEPEVCGNPLPRTLAEPSRRGIELSYAAPQGEAGWLQRDGPHDAEPVRRGRVADTG